MPNSNAHGGRRTPGPGKKLGPAPSPFPAFAKKLRATAEERTEFQRMLTGGARRDFEIIYGLLKERMTK